MVGAGTLEFLILQDLSSQIVKKTSKQRARPSAIGVDHAMDQDLDS